LWDRNFAKAAILIVFESRNALACYDEIGN